MKLLNFVVLQHFHIMRVEELRRLERAERMMKRWMCGVTLKDRCISEELKKRLDIEDLADVVRKSRLRWFGHLERKDERDWVSACRNMVVPGNARKAFRLLQFPYLFHPHRPCLATMHHHSLHTHSLKFSF